MKSNFFNIVLKPLILTLLFFLVACENDYRELYEDPPWLGGSILETLENDSLGTYEIFFTLIDTAGYREPLEKGLFTLFVANDEAYESYFAENGISSADEIPEETARNLVELNLLNNPRARHQLVYDYVFGTWQEAGSELGALTFRIPTKSYSNKYKETARYDPAFVGQQLTIERQQKMVPLFSTEFFHDYAGAEDGSDYTFFFKDTEWTGLQYYNANIIRKEVRTSNGFIYYLDRAVPYIQSFEEYMLDNQDRFGVFYDLLQRFATYEFSSYDVENNYTPLYEKEYQGIDNLAREAGPTVHSVYSRRDIWTVFLPDNEVLEQYMDDYFLNRFESIDSVPEVTLLYLLKSHVFPNFMLPSKMGSVIFDAFGDEVLLDVNDVKDAKVLSNAAIMEISYVKEPYAFLTVTGPLFFDKKYTTFLQALSISEIIPSLSKTDVRTDLLVAEDAVFEANGYKYDPIRKEMQELLPNGTWEGMSKSDVTRLVKGYMIFQDTVDLSGSGYQRLMSGDYFYFDNNILMAGGNIEDEDVVNIKSSIDSHINGVMYEIDNLVKAPEQTFATYIKSVPAFSEFFNLMEVSKLVRWTQDPVTMELVPEIPFLNAYDEITAFIPDNIAIRKARDLNQIPFTQTGLHNFIKYHFLIDKAVFNDGVFNGETATGRIDQVVNNITLFTNLTIENAPQDLKVIDNTGQVITVLPQNANKLVQNGVCHKITQAIIYK